MRRFGIKNGVVIDNMKRTSYPILSVRTFPYHPAACRSFAIVTKAQTFLKEGLYVW